MSSTERGGGTGGSSRAPDHVAYHCCLGFLSQVDVYDTTFLVGSRQRCAPSCSPGAVFARTPPPRLVRVSLLQVMRWFHGRSDRLTRGWSSWVDGQMQEEECRKDLNNDDVTRFGLGQRANFGVVRDSACPFPHLASQVPSSPRPSFRLSLPQPLRFCHPLVFLPSHAPRFRLLDSHAGILLTGRRARHWHAAGGAGRRWAGPQQDRRCHPHRFLSRGACHQPFFLFIWAPR